MLVLQWQASVGCGLKKEKKRQVPFLHLCANMNLDFLCCAGTVQVPSQVSDSSHGEMINCAICGGESPPHNDTLSLIASYTAKGKL